jgi:hypothetical protein
LVAAGFFAFSIGRAAAMDIADTDDLVPTGTACRILGGDESPINPSTLWRWIKAGRISPPLKIGPQTVRFRRSQLVAERDRMASAH